MGRELSLSDFVDIEKLNRASFFKNVALFELFGDALKARLIELLSELGVEENVVCHGQIHPTAVVEGAVYVSEGATIGPHAYVQGPCYLGPGAEVRHAAFIRGNVFIGEKAVVGHTSEVKSSIFLDEAKAGHFAYVGDSLLGINVNMGAGTKLANLKLDRTPVKVKLPGSTQRVSTGLKKFGAILGDSSQTGCNVVLSPGSLLLPKTAVLPCEHFRGTLESGIYPGVKK